MPGQGKYTAYYDQAFDGNKEKKTLLEKVYAKGVFVERGPYNQADVVKVANARILAIGEAESGTEYLQNGDKGMFPEGVYMDFRGTPNNPDQADTSTVTWKKAGDPLNPYVPDVRSPGPAAGIDLTSTDTTIISTNVDASLGDPRSDNPGDLTQTQMLKPNYNPAESDSEKYDNKGTRNPLYTGKKIHSVASISVDNALKLGDSMHLSNE